MVQGVTTNGKFRAFPTLHIATDSKENLAQLKLAILNILAICGGVDPKDLFEKINFRMVDSTAHNFGADEQVSIDLGPDHVPDELLCSTQPVLIGPPLMFSKLLKVQWEKASSRLRSY